MCGERGLAQIKLDIFVCPFLKLDQSLIPFLCVPFLLDLLYPLSFRHASCVPFVTTKYILDLLLHITFADLQEGAAGLKQKNLKEFNFIMELGAAGGPQLVCERSRRGQSEWVLTGTSLKPNLLKFQHYVHHTFCMSTRPVYPRLAGCKGGKASFCWCFCFNNWIIHPGLKTLS